MYQKNLYNTTIANAGEHRKRITNKLASLEATLVRNSTHPPTDEVKYRATSVAKKNKNQGLVWAVCSIWQHSTSVHKVV